jgi:trimethylamine--corrinoid protein Co-methyltransferase
MRLKLDILADEEIDYIHTSSLQVLSKTGMRFDSVKLLQGLKKKGAHVDETTHTAVLPGDIVEDAIENNRRLIRSGRKLHLLNGVTSSLSAKNKIEAKISGACDTYLDWKTQRIKKADSRELLKYIRLGEIIQEVDFVGNAIVMNYDLDGKEIDERLKRIKTAALIAKNTRKTGSVTVWDVAEIDFLVDIGIVAKGSEEKYYAEPCFISAKETISPLHLDENSGNILLEFAKRGLPCTIIPMPITGISSPVTKLGSAIVGNAEILGVITAIQSVHPDSPVGGGTITGVMDMQTSVTSFSAPEAILQDLAIAEVHTKRYCFDYLIGTGYTDAKYPNSQVLVEKTMKYLLTFLSGRYTYPLGLLNGGSIFSGEQALVDLEICRYIHSHFGDFGDFNQIRELTELITSVGIRGHYISEDHTLHHFRDNWFPQIIDRTSFESIKENGDKDIYKNAHHRMTELLSSGDFYEIDGDRSREIDTIVRRAEKILL